MATEDLSTANAALKEYYGYDEMEMLLLEGDPFYAMVEKRQGGGDAIPVPIQYADNAAFSGVLATAQTNAPTGGKTQFLLVPNSFPNYYSVGKIARKAILGAAKDSFAFLELGTNKVDSAFRVMARNTQIHLYGAGSSDLGSIATGGISSAVITLTVKQDAVKYQPGQVLQLSATQTGGAVRAGTITVLKVDRKLGTLTMTGNVTAGIAAAAAGDFIYVEGTYDVSVKGLTGWLPSTVSGSDSWFGVNRSTDRVMLAGNPFDGTGLLCFEALLDAATEVNNNGGGQVITHAFAHNDRVNRIIKEAEAKSRTLRTFETRPKRGDGSLASFGYKGAEIVTPNGTFMLYGSRFCGLTDCHLLNMPSWALWHIGEDLADIEGRDSDRGMLVDGANDAYEARVISYPELACDAPGLNGRIYNFGS